MTDNPLLVQAVFLAAGADPTKLARWMDNNIVPTETDQAPLSDSRAPHAA